MADFINPQEFYGQTPEMIDLARKQRMAQMLMQLNPAPQGQMISGHYVAPSWTQMLASGLGQYKGLKSMQEVGEQAKQIAQNVQQKRSEDIQNFTKAIQGSPEQQVPYQAPSFDAADAASLTGNQTTMPAQGPDLSKAIQIGMGSTLPGLQAASGALLTRAMMPKQPEGIVINGQLVDKYTGKPMGQVVPKQAEPFTLAPGAVRYGPDGRPLAMTPNPNSPFNPDGTPNPAYQAYQMGLRHAGATNVNQILNQKQEGAESQAVGGAFGKQYNDIQEAGLNALGKINRLDRLGGLLQGVQTGKLTPTLTDIAALGESLGVKVDKNLGAKQAAEALSNEIALQMRNPSGGAGMPGALSDKDREFLKAMVPGIAKTPEGNQLLITTAKKLAQRDLEVAKLARDYRQRNGHMDEGFYNQLQQFSNSNPLFPTQGAPTPGVAPQGGGARFLGFE